MLYIGVDLGTSAVKLLLMNSEGKIENVVSKEYPLYFPHPGWSEQKPEDWWNGVMEGLKELTADCDKNRKYRVCRFYGSEDPLDEGRGTGQFCEAEHGASAEGLYCVQAFRRILHGRF